MFSREESKLIRQEFWTSFGKSFPRKWILYNTKIKDFSFKFYFDTKKAIVTLDIEGSLENRIKYFEKITSLRSILQNEYFPDLIFEDIFILDNGKEISRVYVQKDNLCIHNKNTWRDAMEFLNEQMIKFEDFFVEYQDIIKS
ncbi:DUF4268 domain-containing protein [Leptobacterium flavescens]|uniref:DUF4268 domain-containing protein n=1 Tax=Leptobacterium flavescens TaxID=472055 RepID=A0A6P0UQD7_9FLAO|nr:DUF4268 domain-containing protein [Leptobacterium flavescens]NER14198.1 DUF4268 domain-containing protein [Leptobacterium flavescens]